MSRNVLVNLNMNGNEIQNVVMQVLAAAPSNPKMGQYYYNSASKKAFQWDGSAWKPLGSAEITVDSTLSGTSINPVQNKVINAALGNKVGRLSVLPDNDGERYKIEWLDEGGLVLGTDYIDAATEENAGVMSAEDKKQLANLVAGTITVDSALSSTSENPVQNRVINSALDLKMDAETCYHDYESWEQHGFDDAALLYAGVIDEFVSNEVSSAIAASDAMIFKGTLGTGGTITALPTTYKTGWTYRVITAGTYAGNVCEVGDLVIALVDRSGSGNVNADWTVAQTNIDGAITSISGTSPVSVSGSGSSRTVSHANSGVTAGTYGSESTQTPGFGETANVPYTVVNATGHVTEAGTAAIKIPSATANSSRAGLMSAEEYKKLDSITYGKAVISAGSTNIQVNNDNSKMLLGYTAFLDTGEEVIVEVEDAAQNYYVFKIASAITSDITIYYMLGGTIFS